MPEDVLKWDQRASAASKHPCPGERGARVFEWRRDENGIFQRHRVARGDVTPIWDSFTDTTRYFSPVQKEWDICREMDPNFNDIMTGDLSLDDDDDDFQMVGLDVEPIPEVEETDWVFDVVYSHGTEVEGMPPPREPVLTILQHRYGFQHHPILTTCFLTTELITSLRLLSQWEQGANVPSGLNTIDLHDFLQSLAENGISYARSHEHNPRSEFRVRYTNPSPIQSSVATSPSQRQSFETALDQLRQTIFVDIDSNKPNAGVNWRHRNRAQESGPRQRFLFHPRLHLTSSDWSYSLWLLWREFHYKGLNGEPSSPSGQVNTLCAYRTRRLPVTIQRLQLLPPLQTWNAGTAKPYDESSVSRRPFSGSLHRRLDPRIRWYYY